MDSSEIIMLVFFVETAIGMALFIRALITNYSHKLVLEDRRQLEQEKIDRELMAREIISVRVVFKDGETATYTNAKKFRFDYDFYTLYNEEDRIVAQIDRKYVAAVDYKREGDD